MSAIENRKNREKSPRSMLCFTKRKPKPVTPVEPSEELKPIPGVKGEAGDKGETGDKGEPGDKGETGDKGDPGDPGTDASRGEKGDNGKKGEKGDPGDDGLDGGKGIKGEDGVKGEKGDPGERGKVGISGKQGEKGEQGQKGEKGETGNKGQTGERGNQGSKGDIGQDGEDGDRGDPGYKGEVGERGEKGQQGDKGVKGHIGDPGDGGERGDKGDKGDKGEPGEIGEKGSKGEVGNMGEKGPKGSKGDIGDQGLDSDKTATISAVYLQPKTGARAAQAIVVKDFINGNRVTTAAAVPNSKLEGTLGFNNSTQTAIFTPAPRMRGTAVFGFMVRDANISLTNFGKVNVDRSYSQSVESNPKLLFSDTTSTLRVMDLSTRSSSQYASLTLATSCVAANLNDGLIYYIYHIMAPTGRINRIMAYDPLTSNQFTLVNNLVSDVLDSPAVQATALGYDNRRNLLYVGYNNAQNKPLVVISPRPYDRFKSPNVQTYTGSSLTVDVLHNLAVSDITVEPETGYLYVVAGLSIYKINSARDIALATVSMGNTAIYGSLRISHSNNGRIYVASRKTGQTGGYQLHIVSNPVNLDITEVGTYSTMIAGMCEPLYSV